MPLVPGASLGPYQIEAPLGAGGMGEVYKARDSRLDRTVAIKVLPEHVATDRDLRQRFEREAKTVAGLSHPHICPVFDVGEQDGVSYLVMEHLDGETLAQRLEKGALPFSQALEIAIEISDALDKAHRQGIVHRDLKPGNIMLTTAGAKLLDFGLAKPTGPVGATGVTAMPTQSAGLTAEGAILGTLQYMAPEQLEGDQADTRTDIFALGVTIYEMVTGHRAFEGKSQASLIAAILDREPPPISSLQEMSPAPLDRVVKKCLKKDPEDRWQSARDVTTELTAVGAGDATVTTGPASVPMAHPLWRRLLPVAVALVVGAMFAGLAVLSWSTPEAPLVRFTVSRGAMAGQLYRSLDVSPDGQTLVYVDGADLLDTRLYQRPVSRLDAVELPGTETAGWPFFSPDGQWVGFVQPSASGVQLKKVALAGGDPVVLTDVGPALTFGGASWSSDDTIVFSVAVPNDAAWNGLWRVSAAGGEAQRLTTVDAQQGEIVHVTPAFVPESEEFFFVLFRSDPEGDPGGEVVVRSLATGEQHTLVEGNTPAYATTGHLVFNRGSTLWRAPFHRGASRLGGEPVPVLQGVQANFLGTSSYSLSHDGALVYQQAAVSQAARRELVWADRNGQEEAIGAEPRSYLYPRISPDGTRVALSEFVRFDSATILVWDFARETLTPLTIDPAVSDEYPLWSPDSERLFYASSGGGRGVTQNLYWRAADGTGTEDVLAESPDSLYPYAITPDGDRLVLRRSGAAAGTLGLVTLSLDGDQALETLLDGPTFDERNAELSPDGRWMAYESDESGQFEVFVRPFPDVESRRWSISSGGGTEPLWSPSGEELFYRTLDGAVLSLPVQLGETFSAGTATEVVSPGYFDGIENLWGRTYDVSPDGQRFLMIREDEALSTASTEITVVLGWFDELQRLVP